MTTSLILYYGYAAVVGIQILYWSMQFIAWSRICKPERVNSSSTTPAVSIIICGKNEARNIKRYLPKILNQSYPDFEVVFVDDDSTDESLTLLNSLKSICPNLVVVEHKKGAAKVGKKSALTRGVEVARNSIILLTDADCYPNSENWIWKMTRPMLNAQIQVVIGYSPYESRPSILNKFIQYETANTAVSYLGFAAMGLPYMGVGRNLSYRKNIFINNGGFKKHAHLPAGDDDLFVNEIANSSNTAIVADEGAWVYSVPKLTIRALIQQKIRHIAVSKNYRLSTKICLGMVNFSQVWIHALIIILMILKISTMFAVVLFILCIIVKRTFYGMFFNRFHNLRIILSLPLLDFLLSMMFIIMSPTLFFRKLYEWK